MRFRIEPRDIKRFKRTLRDVCPRQSATLRSVMELAAVGAS